ncbi:MAG: helix-turn-helix domain-containing protein [Salinivirgaceae bacterium]
MEYSQSAQIAANYVNSTNRHIFLTGKAGTGKTTFLHDIAKKTHKNTIIAAPTGIAAINAGGVTLHSLFQLPFGSFVPSPNGNLHGNINFELNTPTTLLKNLKINKAKRQLIQSIELLIIDEVSMLRADILDAIDLTLKTLRKERNTPFGGVQMLFIGDMLQLPPVVKQNEWPILSEFYSSMYFFNALALKDRPPLYIELEKVYRQSDDHFLGLLNNLRNNKITQSDIDTLNKHYDPEIETKGLTDAIFITTHNKLADGINSRELEKLKGKSKVYKAVVENDFPPNTFPIDQELKLKKGARVMFIKNDYSGEGRYYNGKIGTVTELDSDGPVVSFEDGKDPFTVEPYAWENKRYKLNMETNELETAVKGRYIHYPLKLAWAVTVHKSQGLTFEKAIIDVSRAFAPGQIYVALSRLTSLDGLTLNGQIPTNIPETETALKTFAEHKRPNSELESAFKGEAWQYLLSFIETAFRFKQLIYKLKDHVETYNKSEKQSKKQKHKAWAENFANMPMKINETGEKFIQTIGKATENKGHEQADYILERTKAARQYFEKELKKLTESIKGHAQTVSKESGTKTYMKELKELDNIVWQKIEQLHKAEVLAKAFAENITPDPEAFKYQPEERTKEKQVYKSKPQDKTPTHILSYNLLKEGNDIEEIAQARSLAVSTIETHMSKCIAEGLVNVFDIISPETYELIKKAAHTIKSYRLNEIKQVISDDYSYGNIKTVLTAMEKKGEMNENIVAATQAAIKAEKEKKNSAE